MNSEEIWITEFSINFNTIPVSKLLITVIYNAENSHCRLSISSSNYTCPAYTICCSSAT